MEKIKFEELGISEEVLKSLSKLGFENPSDVQSMVIPVALQDKDIIVKAQTGSGKTAAFAIPFCEKIELEERKPQVLVLAPTRELALQVKQDITDIGRFKRIRAVAIFGKQPMSGQKIELKQRVHVIVGTPGRTFDHIERGNIDLSGIKYLVIDEADEMLNMGFIDQVESIIRLLPKKRITMLFSATIEEKIEKLCNKHMIDPVKIEVTPKSITTDDVEQIYYEVEYNKKSDLLKKIIYTEMPDSSIIFCNTKETVNVLIQNMKDKGHSCDALHGGMEQKDRLSAMERFKRGEFRFLVATDVAARGISVDGISHVINYDVPKEKESYVHRIGRTGRAGNKGKSITFITPTEYKYLDMIQDYIDFRIPRGEIPSKEKIEEGKKLYEEKIRVKPKLKVNKNAQLNKEITKIHINAGKKKKIRALDIVGTIISIEDITAEDIGIIDIQEGFSYVDILHGKGYLVLESLKDKTIKGKKVRVQRASK
ncbi:DEAD/DEAH box helicase [Clostridium algidicarnis]|uniref:DEAD/DEAH box helicase n=1 Tax=Clostridium algidicarnis TaxID=37659 RepID=UPI001C0E4C99|nr:DEAD/DEAH box helicase [Clostridium algidicarnis]MBU3228562.1 DEAD/DEAH box helicase [Clostridium algidicarnis]MBU3251961.1 DEAD/DEAH box helicase [Clostridium algidicarnis]